MDVLKIGAWMLLLLLWLAGPVSAQSTEVLWWELENPDRYVNGYNDPDRDIWEVRNEAELLRRRLGQPKRLLLHQGSFPVADGQDERSAGKLRQVRACLIGPDGSRQAVPLQKVGESIAVEVPEADAASGIYLLGGHFAAGAQDVDGDGVSEQVHYYGKFLLRHGSNDVSNGGERQVFIHAEDMPLEIGPIQSSRYSGTIQIAHRPHTMAVFYRSQPLAGAEVTIFTERGWQKTLLTDDEGRFVVVPTESRSAERNCEHYLYVVQYHDRQRGEYHCASMPMIIDPPWPEWSHYNSTFTIWILVGTLFAALLALLLISRQRRRKQARLARFRGASCA